MILLGLTGPIGHGKSTFADALTGLEENSRHLESGMVVAEIANALHGSTQKIPLRDNLDSINIWLRPLPAILLEKLGLKVDFEGLKLSAEAVARHPIEYEKLFLHIDMLARDPQMLRNTITRENKEEYRPLLQWLGGYLVHKVNPEVWYKELIRRSEKLKVEGCKLCIVGGIRFPSDANLVRKVNGTIVKVYRPDHLQFDMLDPTERERESIVPDATIISNGTVEDLKQCAQKFLEHVQRGNLEKTYRTADYRL